MEEKCFFQIQKTPRGSQYTNPVAMHKKKPQILEHLFLEKTGLLLEKITGALVNEPTETSAKHAREQASCQAMMKKNLIADALTVPITRKNSALANNIFNKKQTLHKSPFLFLYLIIFNIQLL
ncbi:MAG TPA: hypothetical protein PKL50_01355 [bacterium]|jgi:hypothetical protein|nr:hypothetical protein [bacterium]HQI03153.1 hypothetical protein [bacterium]